MEINILQVSCRRVPSKQCMHAACMLHACSGVYMHACMHANMTACIQIVFACMQKRSACMQNVSACMQF